MPRKKKEPKIEASAEPPDKLDEVLTTIRAGLTMPEVAEKTGFHIETLRKWARSGELKTYKVANVVRVHRADLAEFLAQRMASQQGGVK